MATTSKDNKETIINIRVVLTAREIIVLDKLKAIKNYEPMHRQDAIASGMEVEFQMLVEKGLAKYNVDANGYSLTYYGLSAITHPEMKDQDKINLANNPRFYMALMNSEEVSRKREPLQDNWYKTIQNRLDLINELEKQGFTIQKL